MRWLALLLFSVAPALAESVTTPNVLPDLSAFTTSGSTTSAGGTGHATAGGGTYTSNFDVPLTEGEIRQGFSLNSAVTVNSHPSNAVLATCITLTQASDCRDIFRVGLKLFDGTDLAANFLHEVELDFGGSLDYTFTDTVAANDFGVLTGELSLFGIDAGYHSGTYGPIFSDPSLTFAYQTVFVEQQIIDQIIDQIVMETIAPPPPIETTPTSQMAGPPPPATMTATMETQAPAPPTIEPIATQAPEQQQEEAQATAEIEAEMQTAAPEPRQTRRQKVKAAAQRLVKKIAPSQRYSAAGQATTMVVMNMLAGKITTDVAVPDTQGFFPSLGMDDSRSISNPLQDYTMFGGSNAAHDRLMQIEWSR
jgi:hypothetical protein